MIVYLVYSLDGRTCYGYVEKLEEIADKFKPDPGVGYKLVKGKLGKDGYVEFLET